MFETNDAANGVGLAAPQIGVGLRVFVWKMANDDGVPAAGHVINPYVDHLARSRSERPNPHEETEGCLSVPGEAFPLKRADRAHVIGFDVDGNRVEFDATGWFARCMQHEYDHLNGTLYVDRLTTGSRGRPARPSRATAGASPGSGGMPGVDPDPFGHDEEYPRARARRDRHALLAGEPCRLRVRRRPARPWSPSSGRRRRASPTWPSTSPSGSAVRSSTPTPCSSTAAWTSARPSCPWPSAAASRTTSSTSST